MNGILSEKDTKAVLDILAEKLGVQQAELTPDARFEEDLGADSLTIIEINMAIEEHFNLSISDEKLETVRTVQELFEALADLLGKPERRFG